MQCPICGLFNPPSAQRCDCGIGMFVTVGSCVASGALGGSRFLIATGPIVAGVLSIAFGLRQRPPS